MENNLQNLIKNDKYQVFVLSCPAYFPFYFLRHPWFVLNKKGIISRWETRHYKNKLNKNLRYLHFNTQPPFQGINTSFFVKKHFWGTELIGLVEGEENSIAQNIVEFIENSEKYYPYSNKYFLTGPNSNTYVQWVLKRFPEVRIKLSWRFIGKGYNSQHGTIGFENTA